MSTTTGPKVSAEERKNKVRAVLLAATEPLGPSEIARRIGEPWCGMNGPFSYPSSAAIVPVLRRIDAVGLRGKYTYSEPK